MKVVFTFGVYIAFCKCISIAYPESFPSEAFDPEDSYPEYRGLSRREFINMKTCVKQLKRDVAKAFRVKMSESDLEDTLLDDLAVTLDQCHYLRTEFHEQRKLGNKWKRNALDFAKMPTAKWDMPIKFYINSTEFTAQQEATIRKAIKTWEEGTCVRFEEVDPSFTGKRVHIRGEKTHCYSYIGKTNSKLQVLNLVPPGCTYMVGTSIHEIGHLLGLFHTHVRPDRDNYVKVNPQNARPSFQYNFIKEKSSVDYGVPYDYASIMHYERTAFSKDPSNLDTVTSLNSEYRFTYGQNIEASFMDFTLVNRMYGCDCEGATICCTNNGYPDPGSDSMCTKCMCPSGLKEDCTKLEDGSAGCTPNSGNIDVTTTEQCANSPNYANGPRSSTYSAGDNCAWMLKAPPGMSVSMRFDTTDGFGLYFHPSGTPCFHWVEIRHSGNFTETGPRFCGRDSQILNQNDVIVSDNNEVLVNFRSDFNIVFPPKMLGFKLCFKAVPNPSVKTSQLKTKCSNIEEPTVTQPPGETTTTTTSTTTQTTMTTTQQPKSTTSVQPAGPQCHVCSNKYNSMCLLNSNITTCSILQACSSVTTIARDGHPIRTIKQCVDYCQQPNVNNKHRTSVSMFTQYCCFDYLCNSETTYKPSPKQAEAIATTTTTQSTVSGLKCYSCKNSQPHLCTQAIVSCGPNQGCYSSVYWYKARVRATKKCADANQCPITMVKGRGYRRYCCYENLCNGENTYKKPQD